MANWHIDIVLDLNWFCAHGGRVIEPKARATGMDQRGNPTEFLIYGERGTIDHLRVMIQAETDQEANAIVNANIVVWREALAVTSVLTTPGYSGVATLGTNSSSHLVFLGKGDADTPLMILNLQWAKAHPTDYEAAATLMAAWPPDMAHHLHFLAKFLNPNLPADVRWLQGYRFIEWHFERGGANLPRNQDYRIFLDAHGASFDPLKRAAQTRVGFIEEIRALMAHALLADRSTEDDRVRMQSAATNTFAALESLVLIILNELAPPGLEFRPKPPPEPP
jgi:hypothetical protein